MEYPYGGTLVAYVSEVNFSQTGSANFFDGDTADTSSYLYTWTGERWKSPSQRNTNNVTTLASNILARNTVTPVARSVTFNINDIPSIAFDLANRIQAQHPSGLNYTAVQVCVNGVTKNYNAVGYELDIKPENMQMTLNLVNV